MRWDFVEDFVHSFCPPGWGVVVEGKGEGTQYFLRLYYVLGPLLGTGKQIHEVGLVFRIAHRLI